MISKPDFFIFEMTNLTKNWILKTKQIKVINVILTEIDYIIKNLFLLIIIY